MKLFVPFSGWRSTPIAIFAVAVLIVLGGIGVIVQSEATYTSSRQEAAETQARVVALSSVAAVDFNDVATAQQAVDAFGANPVVRVAAVYDRNGRAIARFGRNGLPPPLLHELPETGESAMRGVAPITSAGQRIGTAIYEIDRDPLYRRLTRYATLAALFVLAALVVTSLGVAQTALRRANRELGDRAEALAQANTLLHEQMEERAKAEDQLRQSQKMQALGQLTGGIAHDFNNMLTVIQGSADMLARPEMPDPKRIRFAKAIVQAAGNAAALTSQLLAFARRQPLKPEQLDINEAISEMRDLIDRTMGERIKIVTELGSSRCWIQVDRAQLQSAILNIASNARDAMPDGGRLVITTSDCTDDGGCRRIALKIRDTGAGMDADTLGRVFEPFFTTKTTGRGTGLGLSQVYGFVSQSGGNVDVESLVGEGTTVTLELPCVESEATEIPIVGGNEASVQPTASVLIVEDNDEVAVFAETLLTELGHDVTCAGTGEEALELTRKRRFDIVFSDVVMPGMGGLKLAEALASEQPHLPVVLTTGYSEEISEAGSGGRPVILKPYRLATLSEALSSALRR